MARLNIRGPLSAKRVHDLIDDVTSIGRATTNTIQIESPGTSREHCRIEKTPTGYRVVDLDSRNGTKVNGNKVAAHDLRPGDVITVGKHTLTFDTRDVVEEEEEFNQATMTLPDGVVAAVLEGQPPRPAEPPKKDDKVLRALMGFPQEDGEVVEPEGGGALKYVMLVLVGLLAAGGVAAFLILGRMRANGNSAAPDAAPGDAPAPAATAEPDASTDDVSAPAATTEPEPPGAEAR